jgi:hypothetical protein
MYSMCDQDPFYKNEGIWESADHADRYDDKGSGQFSCLLCSLRIVIHLPWATDRKSSTLCLYGLHDTVKGGVDLAHLPRPPLSALVLLREIVRSLFLWRPNSWKRSPQIHIASLVILLSQPLL